MSAIERDSPSLKGVLPKDYFRPGLDKQRLGQLFNLVSDIALGSPADRAKDTLGRVDEYFLAQFASAEGKKGGEICQQTVSPISALATIRCAGFRNEHSISSMYTWVPIFTELAAKLLAFRERQSDLIQLLAEVKEHGVPTIFSDRFGPGGSSKSG